jgi:hypothetical protein
MTKYDFKIRNLSKGAQKARRRMLKEYGADEGDRIWRQKAEEQGTGTTLRQKIESTYKKGAKLGHKS